MFAQSIAGRVAFYSLLSAVVIGAISLVVNLAQSVGEVNRDGAEPDTSEWDTVREE